MGYQFIHIETYARNSRAEKTTTRKTKTGTRSQTTSRKSSASDIAKEMTRCDGHSPHIDEPQKPALVFGENPQKVVSDIEEKASHCKDSRGRKLRADAQVLAVVVASHPLPTKDMKDLEQVKPWIDDTLAWAKEKYGDDLKSVILHTDESHPHLHIVIAPQITGELLSIENAHDGIKAKKAARAAGKKESDAYKSAMRSFQDDYHEKVSSKHGMTRLGPKRQRLDRKSWMAQKSAAASQAKTLKKLKSKEKAVEQEKKNITDQAAELRKRELVFNINRENAISKSVEEKLPKAVHEAIKDKKARVELAHKHQSTLTK